MFGARKIRETGIGKNLRGLSLLEFITVLLILSVTSAYALPKFSSIQQHVADDYVQAVCNSVQAGLRMHRAAWLLSGSPGGAAQLSVAGELVNFRDGWLDGADNSDFIDPSVPERNNHTARVFFLAQMVQPNVIARNNTLATGWVMNKVTSCDISGRRRCWEYRLEGQTFARINYSVARGVLELKWPGQSELESCSA